jgi:hypothetical protein
MTMITPTRAILFAGAGSKTKLKIDHRIGGEKAGPRVKYIKSCHKLLDIFSAFVGIVMPFEAVIHNVPAMPAHARK